MNMSVYHIYMYIYVYIHTYIHTYTYMQVKLRDVPMATFVGAPADKIAYVKVQSFAMDTAKEVLCYVCIYVKYICIYIYMYIYVYT